MASLPVREFARSLNQECFQSVLKVNSLKNTGKGLKYYSKSTMYASQHIGNIERIFLGCPEGTEVCKNNCIPSSNKACIKEMIISADFISKIRSQHRLACVLGSLFTVQRR